MAPASFSACTLAKYVSLADSSALYRKPCGVCAARNSLRSTVLPTRSSPRGSPAWSPSGSPLALSATVLMVSTTGTTGITPVAPSRTAAITRLIISGGVSARAASWTKTTGSAARAPIRSAAGTEMASNPAITESTRSPRPGTKRSFGIFALVPTPTPVPPAERSAQPSQRSSTAAASSSMSAAATTMSSSTSPVTCSELIVRSSRVFPASSTNAFGFSAPKR